jgi:hypothetical protein
MIIKRPLNKTYLATAKSKYKEATRYKPIYQPPNQNTWRPPNTQLLLTLD